MSEREVELTGEEREWHVCCMKRRLCKEDHFHQRGVEKLIAARLADAEARAEALRSALERTQANFIAAVNGKPVRDMAENLAENREALRGDQ